MRILSHSPIQANIQIQANLEWGCPEISVCFESILSRFGVEKGPGLHLLTTIDYTIDSRRSVHIFFSCTRTWSIPFSTRRKTSMFIICNVSAMLNPHFRLAWASFLSKIPPASLYSFRWYFRSIFIFEHGIHKPKYFRSSCSNNSFCICISPCQWRSRRSRARCHHARTKCQLQFPKSPHY